MAVSIGHREVVIVPGTGEDFDITTIQSGRLPLGSVSGTFTVGEQVIQAGSGATGVVYAWSASQNVVRLVEMTGTFNITGVLTGSSSHATGTPLAVKAAFPNGIRLSAVDLRSSSDHDKLVVRNKNAVGHIIFSRMDNSGGGIHQAVGGRSMLRKPYIPINQCTFDVAANVTIRLEFD